MNDLLILHNVSKSFESLLAVNAVSLTVQPGHIVGLIGPNGSGKSTLLNLISGVLRADSGRISFDGQDITHMPERQLRPLRRDVQMVFQSPYSSLSVGRLSSALCSSEFE